MPEVAQDRPEHPGLVHALIDKYIRYKTSIVVIFKLLLFLQTFIVGCKMLLLSNCQLFSVRVFLLSQISRYDCLNSIHVLSCQKQNF